jgi:hypothetical protein
MKKHLSPALLLPLALLLAACDAGGAATPTPAAPATPRASYDFRNGAQGWEAGFADYPPQDKEIYELDSGIRDLPAGATPAGTGYLLAGHNRSDDLFMFLKRKIGPAEGVQPNTAYRLKFTIVLASNAPSGCVGIGGAPGEGVTLKAGGSAEEPQAVPQADGSVRMNVDKGEQTTGGPAGEVVGDIANGQPCEAAMANGPPYVSLTREHTTAAPVTSSAAGNLWLLVGTDSGFEGLTPLYYQQITVDLLPATSTSFSLNK